MKKSELETALDQIRSIAAAATQPPSSGDWRTPGDDGEPTGRANERRGPDDATPLALRGGADTIQQGRERVHRLGRKLVCGTDKRGFATPGNRNPLEIVLDASEGFVPLWDEGMTLRWRFNEASLTPFLYPTALKDYVRELVSDALMKWGDAAPIKFKESQDAWDFEIAVRADDQCTASGCTLARAFFPDGGRHDLVIFPKMFDQSRKEQVDTLIHETGHIFGLRHFFANVSETAWPSEIFGEHRAFSIMNYGHLSELTQDDKDDLARLYESVWSGEMTNVNGTPVRLMTPYHGSGTPVAPGCMSSSRGH